MDADQAVELGDRGGEVGRASLDETAGGQQDLARAFFFGQTEDRVDRFLLGWTDEAAGVDDDDVGLGRLIDAAMAARRQRLLDAFRIDDVLRAAECDQGEGGVSLGARHASMVQARSIPPPGGVQDLSDAAQPALMDPIDCYVDSASVAHSHSHRLVGVERPRRP